MKSSLTLPPWLRFAVVGLINMAVDLAVFSLAYYVWGTHVLAAHALGFTVAVGNSYVLNKLWTFGERGWSRDAVGGAVRFFAVAVGGLLIGSGVILALDPFMPALAAKIGAIGVTFVWNYTLSRRFVFRRGT